MATKQRTDARAAPSRKKAATKTATGKTKSRPSSARKRAPAAGRPAKYDRRRHTAIVKSCRAGNYRVVAFRMAGIHEDTGFEWLKLGREFPESYPQYVRLELDILKAEAEFEAQMVAIIAGEAKKKHPGSWLPAMTFLERTRPQRYAKRDTTVFEGGETPIQVLTHAVINDPQARELSRAFLRRVAGDSPEQPGGPGVGHEPPEPGDTSG